MTPRWRRRLAAVLSLSAMVWVPALAAAQVRTPHVAITALNGATSVSYEPPRTPWGDPDLQGTWTSDDMRGVPTVRPQQFGNRLYLNDQEFAERSTRDAQARTRADNDVGSFRNDVGTRTWRQTSLIVEPADGRYPAFTPFAETRRASRDRGTFGDGPFDTFEDFTLYDRCITRGIVGSIMPVVYGNGNRIVQAPGMVVLSYEMVHDTRVIYTDGRPHLSSNIRPYLGDSRARWDGNTLVIETTNFTDRTSIGGGNGNGLRHSADLKITERISRTDTDELRYEVHVDDPKTYTKPFTISLPLSSPPGYELLPYECHEGNYMLPHSLSAEREEDAAIAADLKKGIVRKRKNIQQNLDAGARPIPGRANPNDDVDGN